MKTFVKSCLLGSCLAASLVNAAETDNPLFSLTPLQQAILESGKIPAGPHFNGPRVVGVRTGTPFLHTFAVTGERPMKFHAIHLPGGLNLDRATGCLTGQVEKPGEYTVSVRAANSKGEAQFTLRIVVGDELALTPPMGWNSYDAFGDSVIEAEVLTNAVWLK